MELTDHTGELAREPSQTKTGPENDLAAPQPSVSIPARKNDRLVDRQPGPFGDLVRTIKRAVENPEFVDAHVLKGNSTKK